MTIFPGFAPITKRTKGKRLPYDVRKVVRAVRDPSPDCFLVAAHRGLRWKGVPENSEEAVIAAAEAGVAILELDVRLTRDGRVIVFHDKHLGRATNVAEYMGRTDVYSPFTGSGFNPHVETLDWAGCIEHLNLKNECGRICQEGMLTLERLLDLIKEESINIVLFLDVKTRDTQDVAFDIVKTRSNALGIPAMDWCVWKTSCAYFPTPTELEQTRIYTETKARNGSFWYIPVYGRKSCASLDCAASLQAYATRPYVVSFEIKLTGPGGYFQPLVDLALSTGKGLGTFASLGDLWPWDGREIHYDMTGVRFDVPWSARGNIEWTFEEQVPPMTYDEQLFEGDSLDGRDHRANISLLQSLGFTWIIADYVEEIIHWSAARGQRRGITRLLQGESLPLKGPPDHPVSPVVDVVCPVAPFQAVGAS